MTYDDAKRLQVDEFRQGRYFVLREDAPGSFTLVLTPYRYVAEQSLVKDAIAEVKRLPTKLRVYPGGKV